MKDLSAVICVFILISCSFPLSAQQKHTDYSDYKKFREKNSTPSPLQRRSYMLQLKPGMKLSDLNKLDISVVRILNKNLIIVTATQTEIVKNFHLFAETTPANDLWKISETLLTTAENKLQYFTVKATSADKLANILSGIQGVKITGIDAKFLIVHTTFEILIKKIITLDEVTYAGIESKEVKEESRVIDMNLNPNSVNRIHHSFPQFNGEGMTISIKELLYDPADIDLNGRHIPSPLSADEESNHATDMATIAAGAGNSFVTGRGVAWACQVTSSDFSDLLPDQKEDYISLDTWIQNHSYGTVVENFYGVFAEAFDQSARTSPELLHVFSSGNLGMTASPNGTYQGVQGFANITGNAKMSKNTITIGSVDTTGNPIPFSSRGPAYDGRIKPELVAYSTQGSSNSAALVSGVALLLQQAYKETAGTLPPSALLKSLLINSATDAGPPGLDFITGFGNLDAHRSLLNLLSGQYLSGSITQGETKTFSVEVPPGTKELKITLVWNDLPSTPNANIALVNDIDLKLNNNTENWLPWILNTNSSFLTQPAVRGEDHLNNVEQITVTAPQPGMYTISINGFDVTGTQQFYIAWQQDESNRFEWKFPTGSDNIPYNGETGTYFYWQSTLQEISGRLEYTTDDGETWIEIADNIDLRKGFYRWNNPPAITTVAQARMVVDAATYPTDRFVISQPVQVTPGFNCSDSVMFQWTAIQNAGGYEVFTFNDTFIEPVTVTADTAFILTKNEFPSRLYAIQPLLKDGFRAIRSPTFDYDALGTGCYLLTFFDELVPAEGIYLNALLGTTYSIEQLIFEHETGQAFETIGVVHPGNKLVRFLHDNPHQGLNRYKVRIQFTNGIEVVSDIIENFFLTKIPFAVFPNPVSSTEDLRIFSKEFIVQNVTFRLFRSDGILIETIKLISDREFIPLTGLSPGLYIYSLTSEEGYFQGKLIVK